MYSVVLYFLLQYHRIVLLYRYIGYVVISGDDEIFCVIVNHLFVSI